MNSIYDSVDTPEQVDQISATRINQLHGNPADELKNHRKAMLALFVIIHKQGIPGMTVTQATSLGDALLDLNARTEEIIQEGRLYKRSRGW